MPTEAPTLQPLADAPAELELRKESWKEQTLDLISGDTPYAEIDYAIWSGKAKARTADATFCFSRRKGFWHGRVEVARSEGEEPFAELDLGNWKRGGAIDLDGVHYDFAAKGALKPRWRCEKDGEELLGMQQTGSLGKQKATFEITEKGRADPNLPLLLLLTIHAQHAHDQAAASSASVSGANVAVISS